MKLDRIMKASEIRTLGIKKQDVMGYDYYNDGWEEYPNKLVINGKVVASFRKTSDRKNSFNKIKRMGLGLGWSSGCISDEDLGLSLADPKEVFNYKIISR